MKTKQSPYCVDKGNMRIQRSITQKPHDIPAGVEQAFAKSGNGIEGYVPLRNKQGKPLSNYQYVRLIAELGGNVPNCDIKLHKYCKDLIQSGKSEYEINDIFGNFLKSMYVGKS